MTTRSSSSYTIVNPGTAIGMTVGSCRGVQDTSSQLPDVQPVGLADGLAVDGHAAGVDDRCREASGEPEQLGERRVDALAGEPVGHREAAGLHGVTAAPAAARPAAADRARRPRSASTRVVRIGWPCIDSASAARRAGARLPSRPIPRSVRMMNSPMLATMNESAKLKIAGKPQDLQEVDHVAQAEARLAEEPVGQVAGGAAEQHPEQHRPARRADATGEPDDETVTHDRGDGEEPGVARSRGRRRRPSS